MIERENDINKTYSNVSPLLTLVDSATVSLIRSGRTLRYAGLRKPWFVLREVETPTGEKPVDSEKDERVAMARAAAAQVSFMMAHYLDFLSDFAMHKVREARRCETVVIVTMHLSPNHRWISAGGTKKRQPWLHNDVRTSCIKKWRAEERVHYCTLHSTLLKPRVATAAIYSYVRVCNKPINLSHCTCTVYCLRRDPQCSESGRRLLMR